MFKKFTEQSAAIAEKLLLDALPSRVAFGHTMSHKYSLCGYVKLQHRGLDEITTEDDIALRQNPQVKAFLNIVATRHPEIIRDFLEETVRTRLDSRLSIYNAPGLPALSYRIVENPEIHSAEAWYQLAQKFILGKAEEKHFALDCLELAVACDPKHVASLSLLGCIYSGGVRFPHHYSLNLGLEYYRKAKNEGDIFARSMLVQYEVHGAHSIQFPSSVYPGFNDYHMTERNFRFFENKTSGASDFQSPSDDRVAADYHDARGEHRGNTGFFGGLQDGSRIPCSYDSSGSDGDLYKCVDGRDICLSGDQTDRSRTATICRGDTCRSTLFFETARDSGMITYSAPELGISDAMYVRESTCCNGYNSATGTFSSPDPFAK